MLNTFIYGLDRKVHDTQYTFFNGAVVRVDVFGASTSRCVHDNADVTETSPSHIHGEEVHDVERAVS